MDVAQIRDRGRELGVFLGEFDDCFGRSEPREHLGTYVAGQVSDLRRKSVEPIALAAGVPPRTLQAFLSNARWTHPPRVLRSPRPQERRTQGRKRQYPRLARKALPACRVDNLCTYSPVFQKQKWQRFRIKDGEKGPVVWEVKSCRFYRKQGSDGLPRAAHTLIVARNVLQPEEVKYFVSNLLVGSEGVTLAWLLWIAFSRWPIERCFEVAKRELGMDHFEVRSWRGIHRHLYISQVSQLFCARVHQRLREKDAPHLVPDGRTGSPSRLRVDQCPAPGPRRSEGDLPTGCRTDLLPPASQPTGAPVPRKDDLQTSPRDRHRRRSVAVMQPR